VSAEKRKKKKRDQKERVEKREIRKNDEEAFCAIKLSA
jgi:hypothetical protein